jgi:hypothetical protein
MLHESERGWLLVFLNTLVTTYAPNATTTTVPIQGSNCVFAWKP